MEQPRRSARLADKLSPSSPLNINSRNNIKDTSSESYGSYEIISPMNDESNRSTCKIINSRQIFANDEAKGIYGIDNSNLMRNSVDFEVSSDEKITPAKKWSCYESASFYESLTISKKYQQPPPPQTKGKSNKFFKSTTCILLVVASCFLISYLPFNMRKIISSWVKNDSFQLLRIYNYFNESFGKLQTSDASYGTHPMTYYNEFSGLKIKIDRIESEIQNMGKAMSKINDTLRLEMKILNKSVFDKLSDLEIKMDRDSTENFQQDEYKPKNNSFVLLSDEERKYDSMGEVSLEIIKDLKNEAFVLSSTLSKLKNEINEIKMSPSFRKRVAIDDFNINWAIESLGATIVYSETTSVPWSLWLRNFLDNIVKIGIPQHMEDYFSGHLGDSDDIFYRKLPKADIMIDGSSPIPGICHIIFGQGNVTVQLPTPIEISEAGLEFPTLSTVPSLDCSPKEFSIFTQQVTYQHNSTELYDEIWRNSGDFSIDSPFLHEIHLFKIPSLIDVSNGEINRQPIVRRIKFVFKSNHGAPYTCIYRLRLHGRVVKQGS